MDKLKKIHEKVKSGGRGQKDFDDVDSASLDFTETNRQHWDASAENYATAPWQRKMLNQMHTFVTTELSFIGVPFNDPSTEFESNPSDRKTIRVLDYACGPGTMTDILLPYATEFIGIDISQKMIDAYNKRFTSQSCDPATKRSFTARGVVGDIIATPKPSSSIAGPEFYNFDLICVALGFHHMTRLGLAMKRFTERLKPGGVLVIIDFIAYAHYDLDHKGKNTVAHHGFGPAGMKMMMEDARLTDISTTVFGENIDFQPKGEEGTGQQRKMFMGRGVRPEGWKNPIDGYGN